MIELEIGWKLFVFGMLVAILLASIFLKKYEANKAEADAFRKIVDMKDKDPNVVVGTVGRS